MASGICIRPSRVWKVGALAAELGRYAATNMGYALMRILRVVIPLLGLVAANTADAQRDFAQHERSATPPESRFELIQSTLGARATFRLDKVIGRVDQLVMREDSTLTWERISRREHPSGDPRVSAKVNYQLFLSGLGNRHTFLINVNNGATWQLVRTEKDVLIWDPIT